MAVTSVADLQPLSNVTARLQHLLDLARDVKLESTVEPPLPTSEFLEGVNALHDEFDESYSQSYRLATVETGARDIFYSLVSVDIHDPAFAEVWNFLDILLLCGDQYKCSPALVCALIEELLDSQTTPGCRIVFGYLESRRERLARKHFDSKHAYCLRFCNELLRRLSRAEDATFCGRVFFFLFQTFPLGDKSSANAKAEFHTDNTTKFEVSESQPEQNDDSMEVDTAESVKIETETPKAGTPQPPSKPGSKAVPIKAPPKKIDEDVISNSALYPIFWRLQQDFSDPTRLFDSDHFQGFKKGLTHTIAKFKHTPTVVQTKAAEDGKRGIKRKFGGDGAMVINGDSDSSDHFVDNYNPKYLTSRELFDLELSDLAFQRHILVQSLILIDFLLSLTEKAKKRLAALETTNKTMLQAFQHFTLSEEETKWVTATRATITTYLSGTQEGKLFNRMVETVLARDKNWVRWKVENCPSIVRDPVSTESELEARKSAREATRIRRVPEKPIGSMDLSFLHEGSGGGLEALKDPARYRAPSIKELIEGIKTDELDLDFASGEEEAGLQNAIANKRWRILRQARATRLGLLDKVEPGKDLEAVFQPPSEHEPEVEVEPATELASGVVRVIEADPEVLPPAQPEGGGPDVAIADVQELEPGETDADVEVTTIDT